MPPVYAKPENALKRADELLALGTAQSQRQAFEHLAEVFDSKRFKYTPLNVLEPIMIRFIDLCVTLQRKGDARQALLQFKLAVQTTSIPAIEKVLNHLLSEAELKLTRATEQARKEIEALPETPVVDDDLPLQPTDLLFDSFIDTAGDRERIEKRLIAPAQRFCLDAYDIALDISKGSDRLELIYQSIAHKAFTFCKVHQRKADFRRLCELRLRKDLANATKYSHQQHSVNLADPETLSRHLDTRFLQLETAVELELWQEAFRSVEDVHGLVAGKKSAKPSMMANYYEKLTQIFKAEGGKQTAVFHAAAWARYYQHAERAGAVSEKAPGCVLLSALAVPLGEVESKQRLVALLNLPKMPTRDALVKDAAAKHLKRVPANIREIYNIIETDFQPLKATKQLTPLVKSLAPEYHPYLPALREVVLSRLSQELSQVYDTVSLSHILDLVKPFDGTSWETDMPSLEKFLMSACRRGDINASINHVAQSIDFAAPAADPNRLSHLAVCLHNTTQYLTPAPLTSRAEAFAYALAQAEEDRKAVAHRRQIVAKRRELAEEAELRRQREESTAKAERAKLLADETARREKEAVKQHERDRLQREMEATRREEAKKLAESLAAKGGLKVDIDNIEDLDSSKLVAMQVEQLAKEKSQLSERSRIVGKRVDHLERAFRKEERPLLADDYERQKEQDKITHELSNRQARELAIAHQKAARELKERLARMLPDYTVVRQAVESQQEVEFQAARAAASKKIEAEKAKFKASVIARRKAEKEAREQERLAAAEAERQARDAEERRAAEEAAAAEAEARAREEIEQRQREAKERAEKAKADRAAERAALDEVARKQREREAEAEQRRLERASGGLRRPVSAANTPALAPTAVKAGGWREKLAAKEAASGVSSPPVPTATSPAPPSVAQPTPAPNGTTTSVKEESPASDRGGKWTRGAARGRGGGMNTPPSTRGRVGDRW